MPQLLPHGQKKCPVLVASLRVSIMLQIPLLKLHESNLPNFAQPLDDRFSGFPAGKDDHATEVIGRSYAWPLLARILLATAGRRRPLLPGLLALCRRIQVRLEDHAPRRAHGPYRT